MQGERFNRLLALQNEIALGKNEALVGKTLRVLCDGESKNNSEAYSGRTDGNKIVFFEGKPEYTDNYVSVKIDRAEAFALYGTVVK